MPSTCEAWENRPKERSGDLSHLFHAQSGIRHRCCPARSCWDATGCRAACCTSISGTEIGNSDVSSADTKYTACLPPLVYIHPSITHKHCLEMAVTPNPQHVVPPGGHKNPRKAMSCSPVPQMCGGSVGSRAGGPGPCLYLP